jgi:hypothetical protein
MIAALRSVGFESGGRRGHLYVPWSSIAGCKSPELRSEFSDYLRDGSKGPAVQALLDRIRRAGNR